MNAISGQVPAAFLERGNLDDAHRTVYRQFGVRSLHFPGHCHTQGIGWSAQSGHFVVTCQGKGSIKEAFILLYRDYRHTEGAQTALDLDRNDAGLGFSHPSAIQISGNTFPVAITEKREDPSFIYFYRIGGGDGAEARLIRLPGGFQHPTHLGAMAYATLDRTTYLIGIGYDAADLACWKSPGVDSTLDFEQVYAGEFRSIVADGIDREIGRYNSVWLGQVSGEREIVLFASYGLTPEESWLDIWNVRNIAGPDLSLSKRSRIQITQPAESSTRPVFLEGVTARIDGSRLEDFYLLAAPHDYRAQACAGEAACMTCIYEWHFTPDA